MEAILSLIFCIIIICVLISYCCKNDNRGAIYSTPVVITSQTHQPLGASQPYQITQVTRTVQSMPQTQTTVVMPPQMNYNYAPTPYTMPNNAGPYPITQQQQVPLSIQNAQPPSYNEVVNQSYAQQSAFNPNFSPNAKQ